MDPELPRPPQDSWDAYTPEQWLAWGRQVITRAAISLYRRQQRWNRDGLGTTRDGASLDPMLPDSVAPLAFDQIGWQLTCNQVLNSKEACVIQQLYWQTATQRQAANTCAMSQSMVHRVHQQALVKLRRALR